MPVVAASPTAPARPPRWPQAALLACGVLLLHAGALRGLTSAAPLGLPALAPAPFQVRQVVQTAPAGAGPLAGVATAMAHGAPAAVLAIDATVARAGAGVDRTTPTLAANRTDRPPEAAPAPAPAPGAALSTLPGPPPAAAVPGTQVPTYATQLASAATLVYAMQRGGRTGRAELRWRPSAGRYELELEAGGLGPQGPGSASTGSFDAAGLAPERHVDRRRGRDQRAVNFQRDGGFISFSGPQLTHSLQPGAQDRLSWMLQLPAILQANPLLATEGAQVSLWVASARGESDVWTFTVQGSEPLDLPGGRVEGALRLLRRPLRPFDMQVEVWLDPARQHLPVQVLLALLPGGEPTELRLHSMTLP